MTLRTGAKALIGISMFGIAVAIYEIITCPLAGVFSFSIAEFVGRAEKAQRNLPTLRGKPVEMSGVFRAEASFLVIPVFLLVIVLALLVLRGRSFRVAGVPITPQLIGLVLFLIGAWDFLFAGFLLTERVPRGYLL